MHEHSLGANGVKGTARKVKSLCVANLEVHAMVPIRSAPDGLCD